MSTQTQPHRKSGTSAKPSAKLNRFHDHKKPLHERKRCEQPVYFDEAASTSEVLVCTTPSWSGAAVMDGKPLTHEMRVNRVTGHVTCSCYNFQNDKLNAARELFLTPAIDTPALQCKHLSKTLVCLREWAMLDIAEEPPLGSIDNPSDDQLDAMDDLSDAAPEVPDTEMGDTETGDTETEDGDDFITVVTPFFFPKGTRISRAEEQRVRAARHAELAKEAGRDYTIGCTEP